MNALSASLPALRLQFEQFASSWFGLFDDFLVRPGEVPAQPTHALDPHETLWLDTTPGLRVACLDGCVLLQVQGRPRGEVILVRGESHVFEDEARVAVQAFVATALRIAAPAPAPN